MRTVGLSRLGRSVWMTAAWSSKEHGDDHVFVQVWSPITAAAVYLPVSTTAGLGGSVKTPEELEQLDVRQLARDGRIRLTHRTLPSRLCSSPAAAQRCFNGMRQRAQGHSAYPLLHRTLTQVYTAAAKHLQRVARIAAAAAAPPPFTACAASLLFTGDAASQRHLLDVLQLSTPALVPVSSGSPSVVVALEARRLHFAEVLTLSEHEALETVEVALRPPPLPCVTGSTPSTAAPLLLPCLLVILEGLHLLEGHANPLVVGVTHQLCMCMEALQESRVPPLVWSFAEDTSEMPEGLLSRVGSQHVRLATTAPEDRSAYLMKRLVRLECGNVTAAPSFAAARMATCVAALVEETAHWTVDRLVRLRDAELLKMCAAHAFATAVPSPPATQGDSSLSLAATFADPHPRATMTKPVHQVYSNLYGIDDDIRKVEELVVWPLAHLSLLRELAIPCAKGVLICGPSGSGKTALLSCLTRRLQLPDTRSIHVLSVDGLSLIEKEVGRSEKNIAQLFETARALAPTALFIDNLDALAPPRGRATAETNTTGDRTLSTLLTQMDGVGGQADRVVVVVASAPSIRTLDPAVCRPGRLDVHVHLRLPPTSASADFMKRRLRQFVAQVHSRFCSTTAATAGATVTTLDSDTTDVVDQLVEDYFTAVTEASNAAASEREGGVDCKAATLMSPAEVSAAMREVMLDAVEHAGPNTSDVEEPNRRGVVTMSDVLRCVTDAFARLDSRSCTR
jgi:AAA+ superfamily predicted ATPase